MTVIARMPCRPSSNFFNVYRHGRISHPRLASPKGNHTIMKQGFPVKYFARRLVREFGAQRAYQKHLHDYGDVLGHVFLGDEINPVLFALLKANADPTAIRAYVDLVESMYRGGDEDVKNIVEVTILERLGDDETVLRSAFSYFSEELMQLSQRVERSWGRRDIRIWHQNGKPRYDWKWPPQR